MSILKVGQIVKLISKLDKGLDAEVGDIGKIKELTTDPEYSVNVYWFEREEIEAVHPSEIAIFKEEK